MTFFVCFVIMNKTKITKNITSTTKKLTPMLSVTVLVGVIFLLGPGIPMNAAADPATEFLACRPTGTPFGGFANPGAPTCNLITGIALNDLVGAPPAGTLAVLEPDTFEHTSTWESAPSANPTVLLPGTVTLDLVMMNHAENAGSDDICWSKHAILPDGSEIVIVAQHCIENPLPATPGVCSFGATPPSAACIALAGLVSETVPSLIAAPTVLPAGTVIELNISCPGSSFIGVFFNNGIDVDGDGIDEFSQLTEEVIGTEADKTWTKTDYNWDPICIRTDPDGVCLETRPANINNPGDDVLADTLDPDGDGIFDVVLQVKNNGKISNMNPGAIYALTTVEIKHNTDMLEVKEQYDDCTRDLLELLNQKNLTRNVKVAVAAPNGDITEVTERLYDVLDLGVVFVDLPVTDASATVKINDASLLTEGSTVYVLVKFDDKLKNVLFQSLVVLECVNEEWITSTHLDFNFETHIDATLRFTEAT